MWLCRLSLFFPYSCDSIIQVISLLREMGIYVWYHSGESLGVRKPFPKTGLTSLVIDDVFMEHLSNSHQWRYNLSYVKVPSRWDVRAQGNWPRLGWSLNLDVDRVPCFAISWYLFYATDGFRAFIAPSPACFLSVRLASYPLMTLWTV